MKGYKANKKHIKAIGREIVSLGFPENTLKTQLLETHKHVIINQNHIYFEIQTEINDNEFQEWKNNINANAVETLRATSPTTFPRQQIIQQETLHATSLHQQIQDFDLSNATPIDCMNFIYRLKNCNYLVPP